MCCRTPTQGSVASSAGLWQCANEVALPSLTRTFCRSATVERPFVHYVTKERMRERSRTRGSDGSPARMIIRKVGMGFEVTETRKIGIDQVGLGQR